MPMVKIYTGMMLWWLPRIQHDRGSRFLKSAASNGSVQEGSLLRPGKSHNNYVLVEDETGRSGWLTADAFELIATSVMGY